MLYSQYFLKESLQKLHSYMSTVRDTTDISPIKTKFYGVLFEIAMACEESFYSFNEYRFRETKYIVKNALEVIAETDDPAELRRVVNLVLERFPDPNEFVNYAISHFTNTAYRAATSYKPLEDYNLEKLSHMISGAGRDINILDPRCKDGYNLGKIKEIMKSCNCYGIENEQGNAKQAKQKLDRVAIGSLAGSKISNEVFDVMLLEPPISWNTGDTFLIGRAEKEYIHSTLKYVRRDGICIIIMPYFRMYKDMCLMFAKNFKDLQVRKLSGPDFYEKGLVAFIGRFNYTREPDMEIYHMLRRIYDIESTPELVSNPERLQLPNDLLEIELFRGSVLDTDDMQRIVETSGCVESFWQNQRVEKLSESVKQPLLPFNIGQIGLVLTSGCLDGVIDEGNGNCHVIKGRVSKKSTVERNSVDGNIEVIETVSNRVEINVILPNGEHKVLA